MRTQHLTQSLMQQMCRGVVALTLDTLLCIDLRHARSGHIFRQFRYEVDRQVVLTLGINHLNALILIDQPTGIAYLTTHLGIEGSLVEHHLIQHLVLLLHLAVTQDLRVTLKQVITHKLALARFQVYPVARLDRSGIACTLLLLLHLLVELLNIDLHTMLTQDQLGQVQGETVGVIQRKGIHAIQHLLALRLCLFHLLIQQADTGLQRTKEGLLLLFDHLLNQGLLCDQLGISVTHGLNQNRQQLIHERLFLPQEGIAVTHGTAQDTTDHITGLRVRRQLTIGDRESDRTQVVGDHTHRHIHRL